MQVIKEVKQENGQYILTLTEPESELKAWCSTHDERYLRRLEQHALEELGHLITAEKVFKLAAEDNEWLKNLTEGQLSVIKKIMRDVGFSRFLAGLDMGVDNFLELKKVSVGTVLSTFKRRADTPYQLATTLDLLKHAPELEAASAARREIEDLLLDIRLIEQNAEK